MAPKYSIFWNFTITEEEESEKEEEEEEGVRKSERLRWSEKETEVCGNCFKVS